MFQKVLILVVFLTSVYCQVCFPGDTCIRSADDSSDFKNTNLRRTIKTNPGDFFQEIHFWQSFPTLSNTVESRFKKARLKKESRFKKDCNYNRFFST